MASADGEGGDELARINRALGRLDSHVRRMSDREPAVSVSSTAAAYRPWSRMDYVRRARSFHWSWSSRDPACGVVLCARFGWCQGGGKEGEANAETDAEGNTETNASGSSVKTRDISTMHCCCCGKELYLPWDEGLSADARMQRHLLGPTGRRLV